jgi:outer membrane protein TolC
VKVRILLALVLLPATAAAQSGLPIVDAARITLDEQPSIRFQREQVTLAEGALQAQSGRFDITFGGSVDQSRSYTPLRVQDQPTTIDLTTAISNQTRYTLGLDKPTRSGLIISPTIGVTRTDLEYDPLAANRASVNFGFTQPLLRGRGAAVVTAQEQAARYDVNASTQDLRHIASVSVFQTALAYWNYVAAVKNLDVVRASEARARRLVEETQTLINAGNRPAADIRQVNGNLAERIAFRTAFEQAVFEARQSLGLAMGLPLDRAGALPLPADDFPAIVDAPPVVGDPALLELALRSRADLEATRQREQGTQSLLVAARNNLKARIDLNANVGYSGLTEDSFGGLFTSLADRLSGANFFAGVTVSRPKENNVARGQLSSTEAAHRQTLIRIDDLARSIRSNLTVAQDNLARSAERARLLRDAASLYGTAVQDEAQKLQLGLSTIIDLVLIEDRLTRSLLDEISAHLSFATALTRLRFESGTLIGGGAPSFDITAQNLMTVPR